MSSSKPTLANFLGRPTMDEQLKLVSDFLFKHIPMEDVEIECRLGLLWNDRAFKRLHVNGLLVTAPIRTEDVDCKFLSEVDVNIFAHCNKQLNERLQQIQKDANPNHTMTYRHRVEEDHFYSRSHGQVQRVTVDPETGKTLHSINKKKIGSFHITYHVHLRNISSCDCYASTLDFHNPHPQSLDFRIMASTENKEAIDTINGTCTMIRKKDRISYAFDIWSIDLTKVHTWNKVSSTGPIPVGLGDPKTSYEIELEMVNNEYVRAECNKARQNKENQLLKIAASLLDNLRTLSKFAFPSAAQRSQVQSHHSTSSSSSSSNKRPNPSTTSTTSRPSPSSSSSPNRPSPASASGPAHHPWSEEAQPDQHDDHEINGNDAKRHKTDHGTDTEKTDT